MSLNVTIDVNGNVLHRLRVVNRGHPETGQHPQEDDLRRYEVADTKGPVGSVAHRRGDGAVQLASFSMSHAGPTMPSISGVLVDLFCCLKAA